MLQFTYMQLFVLMLINTAIAALLLIIGIDVGYKLINNKKPIKNNIIQDFALPKELQPRSILEDDENENQFLR